MNVQYAGCPVRSLNVAPDPKQALSNSAQAWSPPALIYPVGVMFFVPPLAVVLWGVKLLLA